MKEPKFNSSDQYKVYNLFDAITEIVKAGQSEPLTWAMWDDILRKHKSQHLSKAQVMAFVSGQLEVTLHNVASLYLELSLLRKCQRWGVQPWNRSEMACDLTESDAIALLKSKGYKILRSKVEYEEV